jgi:hypothetical protein
MQGAAGSVAVEVAVMTRWGWGNLAEIEVKNIKDLAISVERIGMSLLRRSNCCSNHSLTFRHHCLHPPSVRCPNQSHVSALASSSVALTREQHRKSSQNTIPHGHETLPLHPSTATTLQRASVLSIPKTCGRFKE